jgi:hypothetical protein
VLGTGGEEQPREGVRRPGAAHGLLDTLVVVDRPLREDELVSQAMPDDDLPAALLECRKEPRAVALPRIAVSSGLAGA